jgi:hypothetical protein
MSLTDAKDLATIVVTIIALFTLVKGVIEYIHQGTQKRAEMYIDFEKRFLENGRFRDICHLLETDDVELAEIPFGDKLHFLGFFEQIALLLNSKLIRADVAHYMFGYYAIQAEKSQHF